MRPLFCAGRSRGVALIWVAMLLVVLVGFVGLAVDAGYFVLVGHQLQNAADAGALAGAQKVKPWPPQIDEIRAMAMDTAWANKAAQSPVNLGTNGANAGDGDIVIGRFDRNTGIFTPDEVTPDAVKVVAHQTRDWQELSLLFGPVFNKNTANPSRTAIARVGGSGCIVVLHLTDRNSFEVSGNVTLDSTACDIYVNSNHGQAAWAHGNAIILAEMIHVGGGYRQDGNVVYDGSVDEGAPPMLDPLAHLPDISSAEYLAAPNQGPVNVTTGITRNLLPGYYPDGITANGGVINCAPGIYVCDGEGLQILAGSTVNAPGCMFYVVDSTPNGNPKSIVKMVGNTTINITPIDSVNDDDVLAASWYPGYAQFDFVSVFQARNNDHGADIAGGSATNIRGALYFRSCRVVVTGNSGLLRFDQLVADRLSVQGDSTVNIGSSGRWVGISLKTFLVK